MYKAKKIGKSLLLLILVSGPIGCGFDTTQTLTVDLYGINSQPESATGTITPFSLTMALAAVTLVDGFSQDVQLAIESSEAFVIVDRPQLVFEQDMTEYDGQDFSQITVRFESTFNAATRENSAISGTFSNESISLVETFSIETGKDLSFTIKAAWKNIVADQSISEPELTISSD